MPSLSFWLGALTTTWSTMRQSSLKRFCPLRRISIFSTVEIMTSLNNFLTLDSCTTKFRSWLFSILRGESPSNFRVISLNLSIQKNTGRLNMVLIYTELSTMFSMAVKSQKKSMSLLMARPQESLSLKISTESRLSRQSLRTALHNKCCKATLNLAW